MLEDSVVKAQRPLAREFSGPEDEARIPTETAFEKPRGMHQTEVRRGYAQITVSGLMSPLSRSRIQVLGLVAEAGVSIDFLKFTQDGLSFLCSTEDQARIESVQTKFGGDAMIQPDRCIFLAYAVNMRDEEGLVARLVSEAISSGAEIDHIADMHDRVLIVTDSGGAAKMAERIRVAE